MELGVKKDIPWSKMNIEEKYLGKKTFKILFLVEMLPKFNSKFFLFINIYRETFKFADFLNS